MSAVFIKTFVRCYMDEYNSSMKSIGTDKVAEIINRHAKWKVHRQGGEV